MPMRWQTVKTKEEKVDHMQKLKELAEQYLMNAWSVSSEVGIYIAQEEEGKRQGRHQPQEV